MSRLLNTAVRLFELQLTRDEEVSQVIQNISQFSGKQTSVGHTDEPLQILLVLLHTFVFLLSA